MTPDAPSSVAARPAVRKRKRRKAEDTAKAYARKVVGWREWVALPALGIELIQAKIDTGAWSVALHADQIEPFECEGAPWVRFTVPGPRQIHGRAIRCEAPIHDTRNVKNTSGRPERRHVIMTELVIGSERWPVEVTLANRNEMGFRMLLGRAALRRRKFLINPRHSFLQGKPGSLGV